MENEYSYELALCSHDGAQWLEEVSYTPATRLEPEDYDIDYKPCPVCGGYDTLYPPDTQYGAVAEAALAAARIVAYFIEWWGLPTCDTCGSKFYEGWTSDGHPLCMTCAEREADAYFESEEYRKELEK